MKVLMLVVAGLYGWSFAGAWMRAHADAAPALVLGQVWTLRDLHALEMRQQRDYIGWLEGRLPAAVVQADDARLAQYRQRLLVLMRTP